MSALRPQPGLLSRLVSPARARASRAHQPSARGQGLAWWLPLFTAVIALLMPILARAETLPPAPDHYFNDYAGVVPANSAGALNRELEQFERDTSNQLVVAVFPRMDSASSVEDYTVRVAQSWGVGQKDKKNGAVLFVFIAEHSVYIQTGYGLEPVLTDALCRQIIENEINPRFRAGDFPGGLRAGIQAMMAAARGEYQGSGRTNADARGAVHRGSRGNGLSALPIFFFVVVMMVMGSISRAFRGQNSRRGWRSGDNDRFGPGGGFGGGFGGGGGGGGSSDGGGFSGGGGSFGGGGAGGRW